MSDLFSLALHYHQTGDLRQAEAYYRQILQDNPRHVEALTLLGVLADQAGHSEAGIQCISQALQIAPNYAEGHNHLGNVLRGLNRLADAQSHYEQAIRLKLDFADAYNNLGIVLRRQRKLDEAVSTYRQGLRIQPGNPFVQNNLGNVLREQGKLDEALACYQQALRLRPDYPEAYNNLGAVLQEQGNADHALAYFREALRLRPAYPDALNNQGVVLAGRGQTDEARASYEQALKLAPDFADAHKNYGLLLHGQGEFEAALAEFRTVLQLRPEDPTAAHLAAALTGAQTSEHSDPAYVESLFDGYAGHFDDHLLKVLNYRGPELLRQALAGEPAPSDLDILDLGCGTGLCGVFLRPWARTLTGVDLSGKMLAQARQRGIYDQLIQGDLLVPLTNADKAFDLIVAGDVFAYVGDLTAVIQAAAKALRPGGRLAFIVEAHEGEGLALRSSGRFAHAPAYLRQLAAAARLSEVSFASAVARTDRNQNIESLVVVLRAD